MQCHHHAAELLLDAMKSTTSTVALESITLQHSYHLKQKDLIKNKKEQYARVKKAMDNIKWLGKDPFSNLQGHDYAKLQVAIYRAINETDSLLHFLTHNDDSPVSQGLLKDIVPKGDVIDGLKSEKSQQTVIEELQILSQNLHSLVDQLVLQVEVLKDENITLKERVNYLEKERVRYLNLPTSSDLIHENNFSTLSMATESFPKESAQRAVAPTQSSAGIVNANFDITALKE